MNKFALVLVASAGVFATDDGFAADVFVQEGQYLPAEAATPARMVCDDYGRCYRTRSSRRAVIQRDYDSYDYVPRERYIERREYYDDGPRAGVGIHVPGVGVGIDLGGDRDRW
jgi:hypothetical protein